VELTVRQYKELRLDGKTDMEILRIMGYSPNSKRTIQRWKRENGILLGKSKTHLLDLQEVKEYLKSHSMLETAYYFNVDVMALYKWKRKGGNNMENQKHLNAVGEITELLYVALHGEE
jgi:beta-N-acetylglucosaminidase